MQNNTSQSYTLQCSSQSYVNRSKLTSIDQYTCTNPIKFKKSSPQCLNQYKTYFQNIQIQAKSYIQSYIHNYDKCQQHNLIVYQNAQNLNLLPFNYRFIQILGISPNGLITNYQIQNSIFQMYATMLHINHQAIYLNKQNQGGFGQIFKINYGNSKNVITKRIKFRSSKSHLPVISQANKWEIQEVLSEYSLYKICSFFEIGPKIISDLGFDLICFTDSIQFYMQQCISCFNTPNIQSQLKLALCILHKLKIIHKDIKPPNILYSRQYKKMVFTDFGISHSILQRVGYQTLTYFQGTSMYMCPQMKRLTHKNKDYVDLYYNDYYGLKLSLNLINKTKLHKNVSGRKEPKQVEISQFYACIRMFYQILEESLDKIQQYLDKIIKIDNYDWIQELLGFLQKTRLKKFMNVLVKNEKYRKILSRLNKSEIKPDYYTECMLEFYNRVFGNQFFFSLPLKQQEIIKNSRKCIQKFIVNYQNIKKNQCKFNLFMVSDSSLLKYFQLKFKNIHQLTHKQQIFVTKHLLQIYKGSYNTSINQQQIYLINKLVQYDRIGIYNQYIQFQQTRLHIYQKFNLCVHFKLQNMQKFTYSLINCVKRFVIQSPQQNIKQLINEYKKYENYSQNVVLCKQIIKVNIIDRTNSLFQGDNVRIFAQNYQNIVLYLEYRQIFLEIGLNYIFKNYKIDKNSIYLLKMLNMLQNSFQQITKINHQLLQMFYFLKNQLHKKYSNHPSFQYLKLFLSLKQSSSYANTLQTNLLTMNIASQYYHLKNYTQAIKYYKKVFQKVYQIFQQQSVLFNHTLYKIAMSYIQLQDIQNLISFSYYIKQFSNIPFKELYQQLTTPKKQQIYLFSQKQKDANKLILLKNYLNMIPFIIKKLEKITPQAIIFNFIYILKKLYIGDQYKKMILMLSKLILESVSTEITARTMLEFALICYQFKQYDKSIEILREILNLECNKLKRISKYQCYYWMGANSFQRGYYFRCIYNYKKYLGLINEFKERKVFFDIMISEKRLKRRYEKYLKYIVFSKKNRRRDIQLLVLGGLRKQANLLKILNKHRRMEINDKKCRQQQLNKISQQKRLKMFKLKIFKQNYY